MADLTLTKGQQQARPTSSPTWLPEQHGITHRSGYLIRWQQIKTVDDASYWIDHIQQFHPALNADALQRALENVLQFRLAGDRPGTDFLGTTRKVRHYIQQSQWRRQR